MTDLNQRTEDMKRIKIGDFTLLDYYNAPSSTDILSQCWQDKPHRLLYDLVEHIVGTPNANPVPEKVRELLEKGLTELKRDPFRCDTSNIREALRLIETTPTAEQIRKDALEEAARYLEEIAVSVNDDTEKESVSRGRKKLADLIRNLANNREG